jgi:hypothetical protein
MEQEMKKPFKTVITEYFEEIDYDTTGADRRKSRRIRMVTTETRLIDRHGRPVGEKIEPIVTTKFEYL